MALIDFLSKHRDAIDKTRNIFDTIQTLEENAMNRPVTSDEKQYLLNMIKGTSIESPKNFIESVTKGTFTVTETLVNEIIKNTAPDFSVKFGDGHFILNTPYFVKPMLAYDSCNFTGTMRSVTIKLLNLTFIPGALFKTLAAKFPFIELGQAVDKTKLITCHLNKIPKLEDNKILNSPYLQYVTIDHLTCEKGKATIKLKVKSEALWVTLLNSTFAKK
ncbi:MAG: hypothetical protein E3K32_03285 [wastewater metagenome]|nr:hypothetical protein [Candidatus Loosdrechtia aerotolerans]